MAVRNKKAQEENAVNLMEALSEISQEKDISKEDLIKALEEAILQAAQRKYTNFDRISVNLEHKTGKADVFYTKLVVKEVEDQENEIDLETAKEINERAELGDEISFPIEKKELHNVIAQATRQILLGKVRDIEKDILMKKFSDKINQIVYGKVARIERNRVYVILATNVEGVLDKRDMLWNDKFQSGEMIRALLTDIRLEGRNYMPVLSRTHADFLLRLLESEIPEIYDHTVLIQKVARDPGGKSKILVSSKNEDIDPVGACIGPKGSRISPIITELNGERIDVIAWRENPAELMSAVLNVEGIKAITINSQEKVAYIEIVEDFMSAALGRRGQNVRLTEQLTGFQIKFVPFSQEIHRKELLSNLFKSEEDLSATKEEKTTESSDVQKDASSDLEGKLAEEKSEEKSSEKKTLEKEWAQKESVAILEAEEGLKGSTLPTENQKEVPLKK